MRNNKWTKVATFKDNDGRCGHRILWHEATGGFAIADNSGDLPEQTDDGVLWIHRRIEIGKNEINFPLRDGRHACDPTNEHNLREWAKLVARWPNDFAPVRGGDVFFGGLLIERFDKMVEEEKANFPKTAKVLAYSVREGDSILTSNGMRVALHVATRHGVTVIAVDDACAPRGWSVLIFDKADPVQCERGGK